MSFCPPDGCTTVLLKADKDGAIVTRLGDSGGPVYFRNTEEARASLRGINIGGGSGGAVLYAERYWSLYNHLNIEAVLSP